MYKKIEFTEISLKHISIFADPRLRTSLCSSWKFVCLYFYSQR